jgi:hypothetical protein
MECDQIRVVLGVPKGSAHVIIDKIDFLIGIGNSAIIDPYTKIEERLGEVDVRLVARIYPIVDGHT